MVDRLLILSGKPSFEEICRSKRNPDCPLVYWFSPDYNYPIDDSSRVKATLAIQSRNGIISLTLWTTWP